MRVAVYTRISTDEDHQPYSLEAQTERASTLSFGVRMAGNSLADTPMR